MREISLNYSSKRIAYLIDKGKEVRFKGWQKGIQEGRGMF